jgi:hypothetical protein
VRVMDPHALHWFCDLLLFTSLGRSRQVFARGIICEVERIAPWRLLERERRREHARYVEVHRPDYRGVEHINQRRKHRQRMETILGKLQPEAAYFCPVDGKRGGYIFFNMEEDSETVTKLEQ